MTLLRSLENRGYPGDYLLARVRGRRGRLVADWRAAAALPSSPEGHPGDAWGLFQRELCWLAAQMNRSLQKAFVPVFEYLELRTVILCLRNKQGREDGTVRDLLRQSLLDRRVKRMLTESRDAHAAARALETLLLCYDPLFKGLAAGYAQEGLRSFEERLSGGFLVLRAGQKLHPAVAAFFRYLVDIRNLLSLYKHLRWKLREAPPVLAGGKIQRGLLVQVWKGGDPSGLGPLLERLTGSRPELTASGLEGALLGGLSDLLRRQGRDPLQAGVLLDYLWRSYVQARNRSLLQRMGDSFEGDLAEELIR
ncbi:hypothetical protein [uncultured Desulfuromonas sp.]|uniref:hypothetical protein n=2 Tax=Desulfuromonas TaxID=890 RepID=UPI00261E4A18|nr:hypothetical protein [uncultured Desulfuromonas sp.]